MTFQVGDKVVCVDDKVGRFRNPREMYSDGLDGLALGHIYTVRRVGPCPQPVHGGMLSLWLTEIERPPNAYGEPGYAAARFRPVVERKTDISLLIRIAKEASRTGKVLA